MKIPPHSLEAEQSILGGIMVNREIAATVLSDLRADEFYQARHSAIYEAASSLFTEGVEVDLVTVADRLSSSGKIEAAGGAGYLASLTDMIPSVVQARQHISIVRDRAKARRMIDLSTSIIARCYQGDRASYIMEDFGAEFFALAADRAAGLRPVSEVAKEAIADITDLAVHGRRSGVETGFYDLNRRWNGLSPSELTILAARPAMGKTCLAVNMACSVAEKGGRVLIFSLEMRDVEIIKRIISAYTGINNDSIRKGNVTDVQLEAIGKAAARIGALPIFIDHSSGLSINEIVARAKLQHMKESVNMVVVDYLQLVRAKAENRTQEIGLVSRALKGLAKELDAPVLALSQLNRGLENRPDKRPKLSDLRESGEIEQDADVVAFIYRDEIYFKDSTFKGLAEVITAKQRNGPTGTDILSFSGETLLFGNVDMHREEGYAKQM